MAEERRCPRCGAVHAVGGAVGEACPRCLLVLGLSEGLSPETGPTPSTETGAPERIGPFRILDTLGRGATGVVYLAEQDEPERRRVALKVVQAGTVSTQVLTRFETEREALALLSHPGIARVLDAGTTEAGCPWFAMEWVRGLPVTEYCDRERLSVRRRLELFAEVCDAIQHAHTKGILHRDIKPSHVLVSEEEGRLRPRVLDLGVGRTFDRGLAQEMLYTARGLLAGTPGYTSPEQSEPTDLGVDERSDVYSLGVLLYELLVGAPPFAPRRLRQAGWAEMVRVIREELPPRPSERLGARGQAQAWDAAVRRDTDPRRLVRALRGDLDWIALKALQKGPEQRYPSARDLAIDVRQVLDGQPVEPGLRSVGRRLLRALRR